MRFLLGWVSCCGAARTSGSSSSEIENHPPYVAGDAGFLIRPRRKAGRLRSRSGTTVASSEWKPSLCAISEDGVEVMERRRGGERKFKREGVVAVKKKTSRTRVHDRGSRDDYGRASFQAVIPAFSPTPFVF